MGFIGSNAYYALCAAALAILVLLLIGCQVKAKRPPKKRTQPPPQYQTPQSYSGMKFRLQYQIERADGKIVARELFTGTEKNIVPCLETMKKRIDAQIQVYEKLYEKVLPNLNGELEQILEELGNGNQVSEILNEFIESKSETSKPRYAAGSDIDRINRNAHTVDLEDKPSKDPSLLLTCLIGFFILFILIVATSKIKL